MNVSFNPQIYSINTPIKNNFQQNNGNCFSKVATNLNNMPHYNTVHFGKHSKNYYSALNYLKSEKDSLGGFEDNDFGIYNLNLDKLNGIQEGIKVFDDLNMKEIAFVSQSILEVAVNRGCNNMCAHCYADAKPHIKEDETHINKMSWNDFTNLTEGYKELNKRLGFNVTKNPNNSDPYLTSFHDADCINISLKDNEGNVHDFIDINKKLADGLDLPPIFDTAGWSPKDKAAQIRAEKYAEYYKNPRNMYKLDGFHVSVNPFHAMHAKQVMLEKSGDIERAEKFEELYKERMANVLFTFTPLINSRQYKFIARSASDESLGTEGFKEKDLRKMYKGIFKLLNQKYVEDYNGEQKYIKDKKQIKRYMHIYADKLEMVHVKPSISERLSKIYDPQDLQVSASKEHIADAVSDIKTNKVKNIVNSYYGMLDSNGKYYLTNFYTTFPTELQLNFENKNKNTAPISPYLQEDLPIKKSVINDV